MILDNADQVFDIVSRIPRGKVLTYGDIAKLTGIKNPRWVGRILHTNIDPIEVPCHRVVNAQGKTAAAYVFGGHGVQKQRLLEEGVEFIGDTVNLSHCRAPINMF